MIYRSPATNFEPMEHFPIVSYSVKIIMFAAFLINAETGHKKMQSVQLILIKMMFYFTLLILCNPILYNKVTECLCVCLDVFLSNKLM